MSGSNRQLRASSIIHKALIELFNDGRIIDEHLEQNSFYITKISLSKDLKIANCHIRVYDTANKDKIMHALIKCRKTIRYMLNKYINMKFSPELKFFYDYGLDQQFKIEDIIRDINEK